MSGWIKIYRPIIDHWVFSNAEYYRAWCIILMKVNFEDKKVLIHKKIYDCNRGQSLLSLQSWVEEFGVNKWSIQKVRTFFKLLQDDGMITLEGMPKTTRLTVCKYDTYQDVQQTTNKHLTDKQQASNKHLTTTKEREELKNIRIKENIEEGKNLKFFPPPLKEVQDYCLERQNKIDASHFINFYSSKGWMVGKTKMKDWKAAIRTWETRNTQQNGTQLKRNDPNRAKQEGYMPL